MVDYFSNILGIDFSNYDSDEWFCNVNGKLPNLEAIKIDFTSLSDLNFLSQFQKLEELSCRNNNLEYLPDIESNQPNQLKVLKLAKNNLTFETLENYLNRYNTLETLDISENNLDEIPPSIGNQQNLIVLNVSKNKIVFIDLDLFEDMKQLRYLNVSHNLLEEIPFNLPLRDLQQMDLSYNPLQTLDTDSLKILDLSHVNLKKLSENTDIFTLFCPLINLIELNISFNGLKETQLIELTSLSLSSNKLTTLPSAITHLVKLRRLYLNDNDLNLYTIPDSFDKLENLTTFMCAFNKLTSIPKSLCECSQLITLVINDNDLQTVPEEIYFLKNLKMFDYRNNPHFVMPKRPTLDNDEFRGMNFSYENIKNMVITLLKQKFKAEHEERLTKRNHLVCEDEIRMTISKINSLIDELERERLRIQKEKDRVTHGGVKDNAEIQKIIDVESKKIKMTRFLGESLPSAIIVSSVPEAPPVPSTLNKSFIDHSFETQIDVQLLFPEHVATDVGVFKFHIESFHPALIDPALNGIFYNGDCYIVLNNYMDDQSILQHKIYVWIGNSTPLEKMACVAMHAVNLRTLVKTTNLTIRIEQGHETQEFLDVFHGLLDIREGTGTQTSFVTVKKQRPQPRLLHFTSAPNNSFNIRRVPVMKCVLDSHNIFVFDLNVKFYLWCGTETRMIQRNKIRLYLEKIIKNDKKGHGEIITILEGAETEEFIKDFDKESIPYENFQYFPTDFKKKLILFNFQTCNSLVYLNQVNSVRQQYFKEMLKTSQIFIMDAFIELYIWQGRLTGQAERDLAYHVTCVLKETINRPPGCQIFTIVEGVEPMIFKSFFNLWNDVLETNYTLSAEAISKKNEMKTTKSKINTEKKLFTHEDFNLPKIDIDPIFLARTPLSSPEEMMNEINELKKRLISIEGFVLENRNFVKLEPEKFGHFYNNSCYVFLCKMSEYDEVEEVEYEPSYTVFFWEGKDCSKRGWLLFSFSLQKKFQVSIKADIEIERIKQQQESQTFLGLFYGNLIYHRGDRPTKDAQNTAESNIIESTVHMYQVRSMAEIITCRCVEIDVDAGYLSTEFAYIVIEPAKAEQGGQVYVWIGENCDEHDSKLAVNYGERLARESNYNLVSLNEHEEPDNFWEAIGGRKDYKQTCYLRNSTRLFRCTNDQGFYAIRERCADFCQIDLLFDDAMMVDSGDELFIWIGESASTLEVNLTKKLAPVYLQHLAQDANSVPRTLRTVYMGREPIEFKRVFQGFDPIAT